LKYILQNQSAVYYLAKENRMDDFDDIQIEDTINEDLIEWTEEMRALYEREMLERHECHSELPSDYQSEDDRDWSNGDPDSQLDFDIQDQQ
jgi:hypothetical protein